MLTLSEGFVEAAAGVELSSNAVLAACFSSQVSGALLHPSNLPAKFTDAKAWLTRERSAAPEDANIISYAHASAF